MKVKVLIENESISEDLISEHGLSLYIEVKNKKILFDTGMTGSFIKNAYKMGINLLDIDTLILSHGHYDHGGGILDFFKINTRATVFMHREVFKKYYNGSKYIGLDENIILYSNRINFINNDVLLDNDIAIKVVSNKYLKYNIDSSGLMVFENDEFKDDLFNHEIYLEIIENGRKYLISGCSHRGILNLCEIFKPDIFIGGFHLKKIDDIEIIKKIGSKLLEYNIDYYTCHCTGDKQFEVLKSILKKRICKISTGCILKYGDEYD